MYTNWNQRASDEEEQIEPYKRYFFICEGANTEKWYFEKFIDSKKEFNINSSIEIIYLEKQDDVSGWSDPKKLIILADETVADNKIDFDKERDKIIIVFDTDIYGDITGTWEDYLQLVQEVPGEYIIGVTNPGFELFLLLHRRNSLQEIIFPKQTEILANKKVKYDNKSMRYIERLFRETFHARPKRDKSCVEMLVKDVDVAIDQENGINCDYLNCESKLTSNIGHIIKAIMDDTCE